MTGSCSLRYRVICHSDRAEPARFGEDMATVVECISALKRDWTTRRLSEHGMHCGDEKLHRFAYLSKTEVPQVFVIEIAGHLARVVSQKIICPVLERDRGCEQVDAGRKV